jgi:hypothetical protein
LVRVVGPNDSITILGGISETVRREMGELTRTAVTHLSEVIFEKPPQSKNSGSKPVSGVVLGVRAEHRYR